MGSKKGVRGDKKMKIPIVTKVVEEIRTIPTSYYSTTMVQATCRYVHFGAAPHVPAWPWPGLARPGQVGLGGGGGGEVKKSEKKGKKIHFFFKFFPNQTTTLDMQKGPQKWLK